MINCMGLECAWRLREGGGEGGLMVICWRYMYVRSHLICDSAKGLTNYSKEGLHDGYTITVVTQVTKQSLWFFSMSHAHVATR